MSNIATEDQEQEALFQWVKMVEHSARWNTTGLSLLYAVPNGGYRHPATAALLKRTGVKPGVPDMCLPVARGNYHGLYIELKRAKGGVVSAEQKVWHNRLQEQGYCVKVCRGWEQAREAITEYMEV